MQRTGSSPRHPGPVPWFAIAAVIAAAFANTRCWGDSFSSPESISLDEATTTATLTGTTTATTGAGPVTGSGGASTSTMGAGGVVGSTTGDVSSTGSSTSALSPSPLGENCQQLRLRANRDTLIWGMSPDDNYDFRGLGEDVLEVWQYGTSSKRVLLRFEIYLSTPESWTIAAAQLELQALVVDSYGGRLNLHRMQKDWEERVVNWNISTTNQPWSTPGGDFDSEPFAGLDFTPAMQDTIAVWDVTTEVQRIHAGGENYGWMLKEAGEPEQGNLLRYAFPGRDTEDVEQVVPTLVLHFCD